MLLVSHGRTSLSSPRSQMARLIAAPVLFGSAWVMIAELPVSPLWNAVLRIVPAGMVLLALFPVLPQGKWWTRSMVLGALNFGVFFSLQAVAAHRLPSGVAATITSSQALLVPLGAVLVLAHALRRVHLATAGVGVLGITLLAGTTTGMGGVDVVGIIACVTIAISGAGGLLLTRRWGTPDGVPHTTATAWQMMAGTLPLIPLAAILEGPPPAAHRDAVLGIAVWLILGATAVPFALLFGALHGGAPPATVARMMLLAPVAAAVTGWVVSGHALSPVQAVGAALVFGSVAVTVGPVRRRGPDLTAVGAAHSTDMGVRS